MQMKPITRRFVSNLFTRNTGHAVLYSTLAAASRFRGLVAAFAPRGRYPGYNGRVSGVASLS